MAWFRIPLSLRGIGMQSLHLASLLFLVSSASSQATDLSAPETGPSIHSAVHADIAHIEARFGIRLSSHRSPHFVLLLGDRPADVAPAHWMALLEQTHDRFVADFRQAGYELTTIDKPLIWISMGDQDRFVRYGRQTEHVDVSWLNAYYSPRTNRVLVARLSAWTEPRATWAANGEALPQFKPHQKVSAATIGAGHLMGRATHEAAHQLAFSTGLQRRGAMYPFWVTEGLATQYEWQADGLFGLGQDNAQRKARLIESLRQGRLIALDSFATLTDLSGRDRLAIDRLYAQAWGFFRFLHEQHPDAFRQYLNAMSHARLGRRPSSDLRQEFEAHFGPASELEPGWNAFLRRLSRPSS